MHCSDKSKEENASGSGDDDSDDDAEKDVDDEEDVLDDESEEYLARLEKVCQRWITVAFKSQSLCWYKCTKLFVIKQSKGENFCLKIRLAAYAHPETSMPQAFNLQCNLTKFSTLIVGELSLQCFDTVDWVAGRASGL